MSDEKDNLQKDEPVNFYVEKDVFGMELPKSSDESEEKEDDASGVKKSNKQLRAERLEEVYRNYEFPSLVSRIQAIFFDTLILIGVFILAAYVISLFKETPGWTRALVFITMAFLYDPFMVSIFGGTVGHRMMKIRVKSYKNPEKNIWIAEAFFRFFIKATLGWLSFITVTGNERKRAIHDYASGSIVIVVK